MKLSAGLAVHLAAVASLFLGGCYEVPVTGRRAVNLVDEGEFTKVSIAMFDDKKHSMRLSRDQARIDQFKRVGERISKVVFWDMPDADWEFVVFEDPTVLNAFAMAGGKVGIHSGLFKIIENDDQLAAVIAHEIAHVTAKHIHERLSQQMSTNTVGLVGGIVLMGSGAGALTSEGLMSVYGMGTDLAGLAFSRKHEMEADYIGMMYMARAGYDPAEAVKVMERLDAASASFPTPPALLSTHPTNPERIIQLMDSLPKAQKVREQSAIETKPILIK